MCVCHPGAEVQTGNWKTLLTMWNSNLQHRRVATNPDAQRKDTENARKRKRSPTRSCFQLLFWERKNKVTSARWVATYFSKPKNRGHPPKRACKTSATGKTKRLKNTELTQSKTNIYTIAYMWKHGIWGSRASVPQIKPRIRKKRHSPNKKPNWPWKLEHDITAACGSLLFTS